VLLFHFGNDIVDKRFGLKLLFPLGILCTRPDNLLRIFRFDGDKLRDQLSRRERVFPDPLDERIELIAPIAAGKHQHKSISGFRRFLVLAGADQEIPLLIISGNAQLLTRDVSHIILRKSHASGTKKTDEEPSHFQHVNPW